MISLKQIQFKWLFEIKYYTNLNKVKKEQPSYYMPILFSNWPYII